MTFALHLSSGKMQASIADDGIGFEPGVISRGNGLKNMCSRATLLGGDLDIQTSNNGTTVMLTKNLRRTVFARIT